MSNEYVKLKQLYAEIERYILAYDNEKIKFDALDIGEDLNDIKEDLSNLQSEFNKLSSILASRQASLVYHQNIANSSIQLESEKSELEQKLIDYNEEFDVLKTTYEFMLKADDNLKVRYKEPLEKSLNKYISKISNADFCVKIDIDLNVSVVEKSGEKTTDFYSKGYQNLIEICKRFALTDVLFSGEKPFTILDDPFYNLDENKIKNALNLIKELSKEYQIIYLICHSSRSSYV